MTTYEIDLSFKEQNLRPSQVFKNIHATHFNKGMIGDDAYAAYLADLSNITIAEFKAKYLPNHDYCAIELPAGETTHREHASGALDNLVAILYSKYGLNNVPEDRTVWVRGLSTDKAGNQLYNRSVPRNLHGQMGANAKSAKNFDWWRDVRFTLQNPDIHLGAYVWHGARDHQWHYVVKVNEEEIVCNSLDNLKKVFLEQCEKFTKEITCK